MCSAAAGNIFWFPSVKARFQQMFQVVSRSGEMLSGYVKLLICLWFFSSQSSDCSFDPTLRKLPCWDHLDDDRILVFVFSVWNLGSLLHQMRCPWCWNQTHRCLATRLFGLTVCSQTAFSHNEWFMYICLCSSWDQGEAAITSCRSRVQLFFLKPWRTWCRKHREGSFDVH